MASILTPLVLLLACASDYKVAGEPTAPNPEDSGSTTEPGTTPTEPTPTEPTPDDTGTDTGTPGTDTGTPGTEPVPVCPGGTTIFDHSGADQLFVVPEGCTVARLAAWGAGGGGNGYRDSGGGGGAGYVGGVSDGYLEAALGGVPAGTTQPNYTAGIGTAGGAVGGAGRVVITVE